MKANVIMSASLFCMAVTSAIAAITTPSPQAKSIDQVTEPLAVISNRWAYVQAPVEPALDAVAAAGTNVLPLVRSWFTDAAWQKGVSNAFFLQERGVLILGRITHDEAEVSLRTLGTNQNVISSNYWWIRHLIYIQLKKKETERALALALASADPASGTAQLSRDVFTWTTTNKHNMWNQWSRDPVIAPLRALGTNAVAWIAHALQTDALPRSPGGYADHIELAAGALGYAGSPVGSYALRGLLVETNLQKQDIIIVALQEVADALLRMNDKSGVEYAIRILRVDDKSGPKRDWALRASESLDHLLGGTVLQEKGYPNWFAWWEANKAKPIAEWERGRPTHVH